MDSKTKQAVIHKAVKRIESEVSDDVAMVWPAFPGLAKQIALIVLEEVPWANITAQQEEAA